jgi:hypothetical protein
VESGGIGGMECASLDTKLETVRVTMLRGHFLAKKPVSVVGGRFRASLTFTSRRVTV